MKILAIDIGTTYGWSLWEGECKSSGEGKFTDLATFQVDMITLINQFQPDIVVSCAPVRWHDTISKHCRLLGVLELVCQKYGVQYHEVNEGNCKKEVLKDGRADKAKVKKRYNVKSEHVADACLFAECVQTKATR